MKHTADVTGQLARIPRRRIWAKLRDTALGILALAGAVWMAQHGVEWKVYLPVGAAGGWMISRDLMQGLVKWGLAIAHDILDLVRGKSGPV